MIPKRYRVVLLAALGTLGVVVACVAAVASREDPDRDRYERIREGLTVAEVNAVLGRQADWHVPAGNNSLDQSEPGPPPPDADPPASTLFWKSAGGASIVVRCGPDGKVELKDWWEDREPLLDRFRRRLRPKPDPVLPPPPPPPNR